MKILFLGYKKCNVLNFFQERSEVIQTMDRLTLQEIQKISPDFIVSYGYKYILAPQVVDYYKDKILNLHVSYLPWNRGMYPNIWSILDDTPRGVTIHFVDAGIDTGDIIYQRIVEFGDEETLSSSYWKLRYGIEDLFMENWESIKENNFCHRTPTNKSNGTFHLKKESEKYFEKLGIMGKWEEITVGELKKRHQDLQNEVEG